MVPFVHVIFTSDVYISYQYDYVGMQLGNTVITGNLTVLLPRSARQPLVCATSVLSVICHACALQYHSSLCR